MTIKIQQLREGDTFFECDYGINVEYIAKGDPFRAEKDRGWAITGICAHTAEETYFYTSDAYPHYGPKLYLKPQYA